MIIKMGKISEKFSEIKYQNEADVEIKFVLPFLEEFLGYPKEKIMPKYRIPVYLAIPFNRENKIPSSYLKKSAKPDFIVLDNDNKNLFVIEVKRPKENLMNYTHQLQGYSLAAKTNLIVITNGIQFYVYDGVELLINFQNIQELDQNFDQVENLLHYSNQNIWFFHRISKIISLKGLKPNLYLDLTDFRPYLEKFKNFTKYIEVLNVKIEKIIDYNIFKFSINGLQVNFQELIYQIREKKNAQFILKADSGLGKSQFFDYLRTLFAQFTLDSHTKLVPVIINLKNWTLNDDILKLLVEQLNFTKINETDIKKFLNMGIFLLFFDAYDEIEAGLKNSFLKIFLRFSEMYPKNIFIVSLKTGITEEELERKAINIYMEPPERENLINYIDNNLGIIPANDFFSEIDNNNLTEISKLPLFLNYLIIYRKKIGVLPNSKNQILNILIRNYFSDHIGKKLTEKIDLEISEKILGSIAYYMIFQWNKNKITEMEYRSIIKNTLDQLITNFELRDTITEEKVTDFFY